MGGGAAHVVLHSGTVIWGDGVQQVRGQAGLRACGLILGLIVVRSAFCLALVTRAVCLDTLTRRSSVWGWTWSWVRGLAGCGAAVVVRVVGDCWRTCRVVAGETSQGAVSQSANRHPHPHPLSIHRRRKSVSADVVVAERTSGRIARVDDLQTYPEGVTAGQRVGVWGRCLVVCAGAGVLVGSTLGMARILPGTGGGGHSARGNSSGRTGARSCRRQWAARKDASCKGWPGGSSTWRGSRNAQLRG